MPFSDSQIQQYLKVHALVERGSTEDERATAARIRGKLEQDNPGIGLAAIRWRDDQERKTKSTVSSASAPPPPAPAPAPPKPQVFVPSGVETRATPKWADAVGSVFQAAQGMAAQALASEVARRQAESLVDVERTYSKQRGLWRLAVLIHDLDVVRSRANMSDLQKQAFARAVGERVAVQVYSLLGE